MEMGLGLRGSDDIVASRGSKGQDDATINATGGHSAEPGATGPAIAWGAATIGGGGQAACSTMSAGRTWAAPTLAAALDSAKQEAMPELDMAAIVDDDDEDLVAMVRRRRRTLRKERAAFQAELASWQREAAALNALTQSVGAPILGHAPGRQQTAVRTKPDIDVRTRQHGDDFHEAKGSAVQRRHENKVASTGRSSSSRVRTEFRQRHVNQAAQETVRRPLTARDVLVGHQAWLRDFRGHN